MASCAYIVGMLTSVAFSLYPNVLPASTNPSYGLTVANAKAADYGLKIGLIWWIIGMALAIGYTIYVYRGCRENSLGGQGLSTARTKHRPTLVVMRDSDAVTQKNQHYPRASTSAPEVGNYNPPRLDNYFFTAVTTDVLSLPASGRSDERSQRSQSQRMAPVIANGLIQVSTPESSFACDARPNDDSASYLRASFACASG